MPRALLKMHYCFASSDRLNERLSYCAAFPPFALRAAPVTISQIRIFSMKPTSVLQRSLLVIALAGLVYPMTQFEVFARSGANSDPELAAKCSQAVIRAQAKLAICTAKAVVSNSHRDDARKSRRSSGDDDDRGKRRRGIEPADCADQYARKLEKIRENYLWDEGLDPLLCGLENEGANGPGLIGELVKRFFGQGQSSGSTGSRTSLLVTNMRDPVVETLPRSADWPRAALQAIVQRDQTQALGAIPPTPSGTPTNDCYCDFPLYPTDGWCLPPGSIDTNGVWNTEICFQQDLCEVTTFDQSGLDQGQARTGVLYTDANGQLWCNRGTYRNSFCGAEYSVDLDVPVCQFAAFECQSPAPAVTAGDDWYLQTPNYPYGPHATGNTMQPGETLVPLIMSSSGEFSLLQQNGLLGLYRNTDGQLLWRAAGDTTIMQADGNLVAYGFNPTGQIVATFASDTVGNPGSYLIVEDDGYAAVYGPDGSRLWYTHTGPPAAGDTMQPGEMLDPSIESANGLYTLVYQSDGNLVLYRNGSTNALWASGTDGSSRGSAIMQIDGNFVVYDQSGNAVFAAGTNGNPGSRLVVQDDGNVVIYTTDGTALWATNTVQ
jgi:hypothetical protein